MVSVDRRDHPNKSVLTNRWHHRDKWFHNVRTLRHERPIYEERQRVELHSRNDVQASLQWKHCVEVSNHAKLSGVIRAVFRAADKKGQIVAGCGELYIMQKCNCVHSCRSGTPKCRPCEEHRPHQQIVDARHRQHHLNSKRSAEHSRMLFHIEINKSSLTVELDCPLTANGTIHEHCRDTANRVDNDVALCSNKVPVVLKNRHIGNVKLRDCLRIQRAVEDAKA